MNAIQLSFIKNFQKEYKSKFKEDVYIDWIKTKGIIYSKERGFNNNPTIRYTDPELLESGAKKLCEKHNVQIEEIRNNKRTYKLDRKITNFLVDYTKFVKENNLNFAAAARHINRERTIMYYYGK